MPTPARPSSSRPQSPSPRPVDHGSGSGAAGAVGRTVPTTRPVREPAGLSQAMRTRRAFLLVLITLVVPGSAQIVAGNRRLGRIALRVWLAAIVVVAALLVLYLLDRTAVFGLVTRSAFLLLVVVVLVASAIGWFLLVVDAWRLARPVDLSGLGRGALAAVTVVTVLVSSGTMLVGARQVMAGRDLISGVFGGNTRSAAVEGRYNVLLLGGDAGSDRIGVRPDSITLASIDAKTGRTVLFSLPRNLQNIPFPADSPMHQALPHGFDCGDACLLNAVYTYATQHKGIYGSTVKDPGAQATMDAVEAITGLTVNYYVLIDLKGFQHLVDAVDGITLNVNRRVPIGGGSSRITGWIEPGKNKHLDGYHALWFARSREGSSDYERMARQRCVMTAMLQQVNPATMLTKFRAVAKASAQVVSTDIPESDLGTFVDLGLKAKAEKVTSVQFVPPLITPAHPDFARIRQLVAGAITKSEKPSGSGGASSAGSSSSSKAASPSSRPSNAGAEGSEPVDAKAVCSAVS
ncbi:MAG TPA: LCP family protein [Actinomycetales bacterium]|nr:LCP family protein [Actinomycetales bacterium]